MFYESDFKMLSCSHFAYVHPSKDTDESNEENARKECSFVIINKKTKITEMSRYSLAVAVKPLVIFTSIVGPHVLQYKGNDIVKTKCLYKLHTFLVIAAYLALTSSIQPESWSKTITDHPLNILTKTYGVVNVIETTYFLFMTAFRNNSKFIHLFKNLIKIDNHFGCSKIAFKRRRSVSIIFLLMPIILTQCSFFLRYFNIQNISAYVTFFLLMVQGTIICFMIVTIFIKLLNLNKALEKKVKHRISEQKEKILQATIYDSLIYMVCKEPNIIENLNLDYCWFELMQIYDKIADCLNLFNEIYCGQVFIMFNSWLLCTLLMICRSLSPSVKYADVFLSDLFLYTCLNSKPLFLAIMCEMFTARRKRTLTLLLNTLLNEKEHVYLSQVETMIMLVGSRKLEISANAFTVNVPIVMTFAGRIISYVVLIIQYFYKKVFFQIK